jgi:hypothetical protein
MSVKHTCNYCDHGAIRQRAHYNKRFPFICKNRDARKFGFSMTEEEYVTDSCSLWEWTNPILKKKQYGIKRIRGVRYIRSL